MTSITNRTGENVEDPIEKGIVVFNAVFLHNNPTQHIVDGNKLNKATIYIYDNLYICGRKNLGHSPTKANKNVI